MFPSQSNWLSTRSIQIGSILPVSASCQIVLSASYGSPPCWLLFILLVHSRYWFAVGILSRRTEVRSPLIVIAISSVVVGDDCWFATVCRDSVSRILDGGRWYEIWWRLLFTSLVIYVSVVDTFPDSKSVRCVCQVCQSVSVIMSGLSICQLDGESAFTYICLISFIDVSQINHTRTQVRWVCDIYEITWSSKITMWSKK